MKYRELSLTFSVVAAACVAGCCAHGQNLILNGNFATGDLTDWILGGPANSNQGVGSSFQGTLPPAGDAYFYYTGNNNTLSQTFATMPGIEYDLTFQSINFPGQNNQGGVSFSGSINGSAVFNNTPGLLTDTSWTGSSFTFTAPGTETTLQFGLTYFDANGWLGIDDISVMPLATPEPGVMALTGIGAGLLVILGRKRVRSQRKMLCL